VLMYPPVDRRADLSGPEGNAALDAEVMDWFWEAYAPGDLGDLPEVSVVNADLAGQPPVLLVTSEHDLLCEQGEAYAVRLAEAGVEVTAFRALGMVHAYWRRPELFDASRASVTMAGALLDACRARSR
jgi:acetyl esterase